MKHNHFVTSCGLVINNITPSKFGGWYGHCGDVTVHYCFDFTISEIDVWNRIEQRALVPGELDIVQIPDNFNVHPEEHWHCYSEAEKLKALFARGLIKKTVQLKFNFNGTNSTRSFCRPTINKRHCWNKTGRV